MKNNRLTNDAQQEIFPFRRKQKNTMNALWAINRFYVLTEFSGYEDFIFGKSEFF